MFEFPNSTAMDATASSGGPSTFLPQILTGSPEQIAAHSAQLLAKAAQFTTLVTQLTKATQQLSTVWQGNSSAAAVKKITASVQSLQQIISTLQNAAKLLGISGTMVKSAQDGYRGVVGAVNPTVASLMSNPWTYSAATALSTTTSASLKGFITAIGAMLKALGVGQLGAEVAALATIIGDIQKLVTAMQGAPATAAGTVPTNQTISANPVIAPQAPAPVASAAGQQALQGIANYTPPALAGYPNSSLPTVGSTPGSVPSINPNNSWIAVDPTNPGTTGTNGNTVSPTPVPAAAGGQEVKITTTDNGITTTVEVPAGQAAQINLDTTINNDHVQEHLKIGADGSVSVS